MKKITKKAQAAEAAEALEAATAAAALAAEPQVLHKTDSLYRGIVVSCLRVKQLIKGATPRTSAEFSHKRKNTRIAVEEVKQGLIPFEIIPDELI